MLFQKYKDPVFMKADSDLESQLNTLKQVLPEYSEPVRQEIQKDIQLLEYGIAGEKRIEYELKNSHIPMYVLHDVYFEHNGLTAQIDYMVFTNKCVFIIECKNLYGKIDINNKGEFQRTVYSGGRYYKEGIYSPITQNERHLELIRSIKLRTRFRVFMNVLGDDYFLKQFIPVVVIANDKTVLNDRYAKKETKNKIIKSDQLISFIKETNRKSEAEYLTDKEMREAAESWLSKSFKNETDYLKKYRDMEAEMKEKIPAAQPEKKQPESDVQILCPRCGAPMLKRTAKKGNNAGKQFYGCTNYPKCRGIVNIKNQEPDLVTRFDIHQAPTLAVVKADGNTETYTNVSEIIRYIKPGN